MRFNHIKLGLYKFINKLLLRKPTLHCVGDSHVAVFEFIKNKYPFSLPFQVETLKIPGATISGIQNPNSKTQAKIRIKEYLKKVEPQDYVLTLFGEVDCGFVIWYRSEKYNESITVNLQRAVNNYNILLDEIKKIVGTKVLVCHAPLPTIKDDVNNGEVALQRSGIKASQKDRTELTINFNTLIEKLSASKDLYCVSTNDFILSQKTGLIKNKFLNKNELDHHLDPLAYSKIIIRAIYERFSKKN